MSVFMIGYFPTGRGGAWRTPVQRGALIIDRSHATRSLSDRSEVMLSPPRFSDIRGIRCR